MKKNIIHCEGDILAYASKGIKIHKKAKGKSEDELFNKIVNQAEWINKGTNGEEKEENEE